MFKSMKPWEFGKEEECRAQKTCIICEGKDLFPYLNLGEQPLANNYLSDLGRARQSKKYPLGLNFCPVCKHSQLTHFVNPKLMFENYPYVSGTSNTIRAYFKNFAYGVDSLLGPKLGGRKRVLDIASNDGSLLKEFKNLGWETLGIDPAVNLLSLSKKNGIETKPYFFSQETADKMRKKEKIEPFDIIIAQNVVAHVKDPVDFIYGCRTLLKEEGILYVQTSQADMLANYEYDTVYHEHISFFNLRSFDCLINRCGFYLYDVQIAPVHGESYLFVCKPSSKHRRQNYTPKVLKSVVERHKKEILEEKRYDKQFYSHFQSRIDSQTSRVKEIIENIRAENPYLTFCGFGAAAKGNTFLNYSGISLDFIVDENPLKQNRYTPGSNIPIKHPTELYNSSQDLIIVILAWNFYDEIKQNIKEHRPKNKDRFLRIFPLPELTF